MDFGGGEAVRVEFDRGAYSKYRPNEGLSLYRRGGRTLIRPESIAFSISAWTAWR